jgi:NMD protein affecting ribosome stability and mRNA decay
VVLTREHEMKCLGCGRDLTPYIEWRITEGMKLCGDCLR